MIRKRARVREPSSSCLESKDNSSTSSISSVDSSSTSPVVKNTHKYTKKNTLIVLDFDDTIFPSWWMTRLGGIDFDFNHFRRQKEKNEKETSEKTEKTIDKLGKSCESLYGSTDEFDIVTYVPLLLKLVKEFIRVLEQHGDIIILTNSEYGWLDVATKHLWNENPYEHIKRISARDLYSSQINDFTLWKEYALKEYLDYHIHYQHIISYGDLVYDRNMVYNTVNKLKRKFLVKTIKLMEHTNIYNMCLQTEILVNSFYEIYDSPKVIDVMIMLK